MVWSILYGPYNMYSKLLFVENLKRTSSNSFSRVFLWINTVSKHLKDLRFNEIFRASSAAAASIVPILLFQYSGFTYHMAIQERVTTKHW